MEEAAYELDNLDGNSGNSVIQDRNMEKCLSNIGN